MRGPSEQMLSASLLSIALLFGNTMVFAQEKNTQHPLPGITVKACEVEGTMVAQALGLSTPQTAKLIDAYRIAREGVMIARAQLAQYMGVDYVYIRKSIQEERVKLETEMKKFLTPDQTKNAIVLLGSFSRRWDTMAMVIDGATLSPQSRADATKRFLRFVAECDNVMQEAEDENTYEAARQKVGELKKILDADMAAIFSPEQMVKWLNATDQSNRGAVSGRHKSQPGDSHEEEREGHKYPAGN